MKKLFAVTCLLYAVSAVAIAQEEKPLVPKPPKTPYEAALYANDAARTASMLKEVETRIKENEDSTIRLAERMEIHNAQYPTGECTYTVENPTLCDPWIEEGNELNTMKADLIEKHEEAIIEKVQLREFLNMRLARLRIAKILEGLTEWEREVIRCSQLPSGIAAQICLIEAWEHHP